MRVVVHEHFRTSAAVIRREWTFADLLDAHVSIDALDAIRKHYEDEAQAEARRAAEASHA